MSNNNITEAIEYTTFKLTGVTCQQFIAANEDVDAFLKRQTGFRSRRIAEMEDGTIFDMLIWDSVENGTQAMMKLMSELKDSPVHAMIDQQTVSWNISPVKYQSKQIDVANAGAKTINVLHPPANHTFL
jgi:hypothetical protein